jgi:hypothetical protein
MASKKKRSREHLIMDIWDTPPDRDALGRRGEELIKELATRRANGEYYIDHDTFGKQLDYLLGPRRTVELGDDELGDEEMRHVRCLEKSGRMFNGAAMFLDLLLEPEAAENTIGDLRELYGRRRATRPRYAMCWLFFQVGWVLYGRAMDIYGRFTRARVGK